jgi:hypothetical protein
MGEGGVAKASSFYFFTCLKYAKNKSGEGGWGEVVDISHNLFWLHDASNYKIFSFGLRI